MAVNNVPFCNDTVVTNLQLAANIGSLAGHATSYGGLKAAVAITQDRTLAGIDPRDCSNRISKVGVDYGVSLEFHESDYTPLVMEATPYDTCDAGQSATPSSFTSEFKITQFSKFDISVGSKDWYDSCCDFEPYHKAVLAQRKMGVPLGTAINTVINKNMIDGGTYDRLYNATLIAERIANHMNAPTIGELAKINSYILDKIDAAVGYNHAIDIVTGDPVGMNDWELPCLVSAIPNCSIGLKKIDGNAFRIQLEDFVRRHPRCGKGFTVIGGSIFVKLAADLGIDSGNFTGVDKNAALQRALGFLGNFEQDDTIDAKFGDGTFFIVENETLAFFWFTLYNDPRYNRQNDYLVETAKGDKFVEKDEYRDAGIVPFTVGNCRNGVMTLPFDMRFHTPRDLGCFDNRVFNLSFKARYDLWTRPAYGNPALNPQTGIYKGTLTDLCPVV